MPLIPVVLDRSERMLCKPLTQFHPFDYAQDRLLLVFTNSPFHLIQQVLIHPAGDAPSLFAAGTPGLDRTLRTSAGDAVLDVPALLRGLKAEGELLSRRAPVTILCWIIVEIVFGEEPQLTAN